MGLSITWLSPEANRLNAPYFKRSLRCTVTVCTQLSAVKTFFFGHKNLAFAPFLQRLDGGLLAHADKGTKVCSAPSLSRRSEAVHGDPPGGEGSVRGHRREHSLRTAATQAPSRQLPAGGRRDDPPDVPVTAGSEAWGDDTTQRTVIFAARKQVKQEQGICSNKCAS